jgi:hypothetical protein
VSQRQPTSRPSEAPPTDERPAPRRGAPTDISKRRNQRGFGSGVNQPRTTARTEKLGQGRRPKIGAISLSSGRIRNRPVGDEGARGASIGDKMAPQRGRSPWEKGPWRPGTTRLKMTKQLKNNRKSSSPWILQSKNSATCRSWKPRILCSASLRLWLL